MATLPIEDHFERICSKIDDNRVTILSGATGCGKSTKVPKLLRDHLQARVLCVQPRRMAVVAVATRVAELLDVTLGGPVVGFHIGASMQAESDKTELMFVTAGIFLEMLKSNGAASVAPYGAVVIDEVHERSCENDLALACLMQLATTQELRSLKIILMSATADVGRYQRFVQPLCTDGQPGLYNMGSKEFYDIKRRWLKDALAEADHSCDYGLEYFEQHDREVVSELTCLISKLSIKLVARTIKEDGAGCTVLVFLPTYMLIEAVHKQLSEADSLPHNVPLYVLHSSVDIEDCMAALHGEDGAAARVVLASSVAESSITIKSVTHVIDSCRSCEIRWSPMSGEAKPNIVWVSQAQANQRAGRTGRTNDGTVWRLVAAQTYHAFAEWEMAAMQLQLLRKEVLLLTCSKARQVNNGRKLLASCLDPPKEDTVTRAETHLLDSRLVERQQLSSRKQRAASLLQPTPLGQLVDAMPLDIDASKLVLYGALCGLLEEAAVLAVLRSSQPMPLKREPNKLLEHRRLIAHYGPLHAEQEQDTFKEDEMLANLAAYLAFQRRVLDPRRLRRVRRPSVNANMELEGESVLVSGLKNRPELNGERVEVGKYDAARGRYAVTLGSGEMVLLRGANLIEAEAEWCRERKISHTALLATTRTVDHVLRRVFHFFPPVLRHHLERRASRPAPTHATHDFAALESLPESKQRGGGGSIFRLLVDKRAETLLRKLLQTLRPPQDRHTESAATPSDANGPCFFYRRGCCSVEPCPFGHEVSADTRPLCKFALSGTCRFGAARCRFRHPNAKTTTQQDPEVTAIQRQVQLGLGGSLMSMFAKVETVGAITSGPEANCKPAPDYLNFQSVLLLGEGDFTFAAELASAAKSNTLRMLRPHAIIATTLQSNAKVLASHPKRASLAIAELQSAGSSVCFCFDAQEIDTSDLGPGLECVVWNMPFAADVLPGESVKSDPNQQLLRGFFASVIRYIERWHLNLATYPKVYVTVGLNQFADWGLLAVAYDSFLYVEAVHEFKAGVEYAPRRNERADPFDVGQMRTYAFAVDAERLVAADFAVALAGDSR